jgi:hypothetical protein
LRAASTKADATELAPKELSNKPGKLLVVWALVFFNIQNIRGLVLAHVSGDTYRRVGVFEDMISEYHPTERKAISII